MHRPHGGEARHDHRGPLNRFAATLDRNWNAFAAGGVIPPLAHWLFFLPDTPHAELGPDGHAKRGGFIPASMNTRAACGLEAGSPS
jgi:3-methylfumaryl-CoA hydratase